MSEERIETAEELASGQQPLAAEDLEKISGGLAEAQQKLSNHEESQKTWA